MGGRAKRRVFVCDKVKYQFKIDYYNFRILYVIPIEITKKFIEFTEKEMRIKIKMYKSKWVRKLNTKEDSKGGTKHLRHKDK